MWPSSPAHRELADRANTAIEHANHNPGNAAAERNAIAAADEVTAARQGAAGYQPDN